MRLLADIAKDLYVMEASLLRTEKNANEKTKHLMTDIICQEGYRKIEKVQLILFVLLKQMNKSEKSG